MDKLCIKVLTCGLVLGSVFLFCVSVFAAENHFNGVKWTVDTSNEPSQRWVGGDRIVKVDSFSRSIEPFKFIMLNNEKAGDQQQEFQFEKRSGYHWMVGKFTINPLYKDFNNISLARTLNIVNQFETSFSTYFVRKSNNSYEFGLLGNNEIKGESDAQFESVKIDLAKEYTLSIKTHSEGQSSYETARLYDNSGTRIWEKTTVANGAASQFRKIGVYKLPKGYGPIEVLWRDMKFYSGRK